MAYEHEDRVIALMREVEVRANDICQLLRAYTDAPFGVILGQGLPTDERPSPNELASMNGQFRARLGIRHHAIYKSKRGPIEQRFYPSSGLVVDGHEMGGRIALIETWEKARSLGAYRLTRVTVVTVPVSERAFVRNTDKSTRKRAPMILSHASEMTVQLLRTPGTEHGSFAPGPPDRQAMELMLAAGIDIGEKPVPKPELVDDPLLRPIPPAGPPEPRPPSGPRKPRPPSGSPPPGGPEDGPRPPRGPRHPQPRHGPDGAEEEIAHRRREPPATGGSGGS